MSLNREHAIRAFNTYVSAYDPADIKIKLKIAHTFRVAALADTIAHSLDLTQDECDFAWGSGLLHDVGRFEQLRRYHTFNDAQSVNHGGLSADILFREGRIDAYGFPPEWYPMLETVIRLHNVYELPDSLTPEEHRFAAILRDADKVDIFRVNCETPMEEIYDCPLQEFKTSPITDAVLAPRPPMPLQLTSPSFSGLNIPKASARLSPRGIFGKCWTLKAKIRKPASACSRCAAQ